MILTRGYGTLACEEPVAPRERIDDAALRNSMVTSSIVVAEFLYGTGRLCGPKGTDEWF